MAYKVVSDYTQGLSTNTNVQVYVRARPPSAALSNVSPKELEEHFGISKRDPKRIEVKRPGGTGEVGGGGDKEHAFSFDRVYWTDTAQEEIFNTVCKNHIEHCLKGYNSCTFAYGQTGSGKTHTMFGEKQGDIRGLVPRTIEYLFAQVPRQAVLLKDVKVEVSFLEIYCGKIRDLGRAYRDRMAAALGATTGAGDVTAGDKAGRGSQGGANNGGGLGSAPATPQVKRSSSNGTVPSSPGGTLRTPYADAMTSDMYLLQEARRAETFQRGGAHGGEKYDQRRASIGGISGSDTGYLDMDLAIHEDAAGDVYVKDLVRVPVGNFEEAMRVVYDGLALRATHETKMNDVSSRSHSVVTLIVNQTDKSTGTETSARLNLVDLAGSERLKKSESQGMRLKEALFINSSLTALGKVVMALDPHNRGGMGHVPYRDDKLTRVLQSSLGGNSYTALVATIHPAEEYLEECLSTLQFANRCRVVQNQPRITYTGEETPEAKDKRIKALSEENKQLRKRLVAAGLGDAGEEDDPLENMLGMGGGAGGGGGPRGLLGKGHEAARQRDMIAKAANKMILKVLAELGIPCQLSDDGRVLLEDGRVVGHQVSGGSGGEGGSNDSANDSDGEDGGDGLEAGLLGGGRSGKGGSSKQDVKRIKQLEREAAGLRQRLLEVKALSDTAAKEAKAAMDEQQRTLRADAAAAHLEAKKFKRQAKATGEAGAAAQATLEAAHSADLKQAAGRSEALLTEQAELAASRAAAMMANASDKHHQPWPPGTGRKVSEKEMAASLGAHEASRKAELVLLREQYEYWMKLRDDDAASFVAQFNAYRKEAKAKNQALEGELLRVFSHAKALEAVVRRVEKGEYAVRQRGASSRVVVPCIPLQDRPVELELLEDDQRPPDKRGTGNPGADGTAGEIARAAHAASAAEAHALDGLPCPRRLPLVRRALARRAKWRQKSGTLAQEAAAVGVAIEHLATSHARRAVSNEKHGGGGVSDGQQQQQRLLQGGAGAALRQGDRHSSSGGGGGGGANLYATTAAAHPPRWHRNDGSFSATSSVMDFEPPPREGLAYFAADARRTEDASKQRASRGRLQGGGGHAPSKGVIGENNDESFTSDDDETSRRRRTPTTGNQVLEMDVDEICARLQPSTLASLPESQLRHELDLVRDYLAVALPHKVDALVLAELQGSDTVNYLATLESRLQAKDELIATQAKRLNALKAAKESLVRAQETAKAQRHPSNAPQPAYPPMGATYKEVSATKKQRPKSAGATRSAKYSTQEFISQPRQYLP